MEHIKKSGRRRFWGCLVIVLCILLVPVVVGLAYNFAEHNRFEERLEKLRARGIPVTTEEAVKWHSLSEDENAIEELADAELLGETAESDWQAVLSGKEKWENFNDTVSWATPDPEMDDTIADDKDFIRNFYVKHADYYKKLLKILKPNFAMFERIKNYKGINKIKDFTFDELCGPLMQMRTLTLHFQTVALYNLYVTGDMDACAEYICKGIRLSEMMMYEKSLIGKLVSVAIAGITVSTFQQVLLDDKMDTANLRKIAQDFAKLTKQEKLFMEFIVAERLLALNAMRSVKLGENGLNMLLSGTTNTKWMLISFAYSQFALYGDANKYLDFMQTFEETAEKKWEARFSDPYNFTELKEIEENPYLYFFTSMLTGSLWNSVIHAKKHTVNSALCAMAGELAADRREGKPLPADLSGFPYKDPFTDKPYKMAVKGDYIYLYSLGPDQKDSGKWDTIDIGKMAASDVDEIILRVPLNKGKQAGSQSNK